MEGPAIRIITMSLFSELRRRNVLKVALLYAVTSLLVAWAVDLAVSGGIAPLWTKEFVLLLLAIGFPVALIFAWVYEITPQGVKKGLEHDQTQSIVYKTGHKLNAAVAVLGVLGVAALIGERLLPEFEFVRPGAGRRGSLAARLRLTARCRCAEGNHLLHTLRMACALSSGRITTFRTWPCTTSCVPVAVTSTRASAGCRTSSST